MRRFPPPGRRLLRSWGAPRRRTAAGPWQPGSLLEIIADGVRCPSFPEAPSFREALTPAPDRSPLESRRRDTARATRASGPATGRDRPASIPTYASVLPPAPGCKRWRTPDRRTAGFHAAGAGRTPTRPGGSRLPPEGGGTSAARHATGRT